MTPSLLAVDTNFLMDLARSNEAALDALEIIRHRARGTRMMATLTVLDELDHKAHNDPDFETRAHARKAMSNMRAWGVSPVELADPQDSIAHSIANKLLIQGVVPWEERNDARILAEAAVLGCQMLITSDSDLCGADRAQVAHVLRERGMPAVVIRTPREIVREFGGR